VELGGEPEIDGLPASHIMADAFRLWGPNASGPMSNPILVSGSGPKPPPGAVPGGMSDESSAGASDDWSLAPLLRQMADLHGRTVAEFQQTLALVAQLFARVKREHLTVLLHELNRNPGVDRGDRRATGGDRAAGAGTGGHRPGETPPRGRREAEVGRRLGRVGVAVGEDPAAGTASHPPLPAASGTDVARLRDCPRRRTVGPRLQQDRAARWQALVATFNGL